MKNILKYVCSVVISTNEKKKAEKRVENRYKGCSLYREAKEDLAEVTRDRRKAEGQGEEGAEGGGRGSACGGTAKPGGRRKEGACWAQRPARRPCAERRPRTDEVGEGSKGQVAQASEPL